MKIGELFVDLDFRSGGALNKLTNFSVKFLALKAAAGQLGDTFDAMFGSMIRGVVEMDNLNNTTGLNIEKMQKWKAVAEQNNVAFGDVISSLKNLQSASADIMLGKGNAAPFVQLGIDMTRPREAFELLNEIRARIGEIKDPGLRRNLLQEMGVSENMLILFKNFNGYFDKNLQLTKDERAAVMDLNKEWIALKQTAGFAWDKVFAQGAAGAAKFIKTIRGIITEYSGLITGTKDLGQTLEKVFQDLNQSLKKMAEDNAFIHAITTLADALHQVGEWLGIGTAYAVQGWNAMVGAAESRTDESEYNKAIYAKRQELATTYGFDSKEYKDFLESHPLQEQNTGIWNRNINDLNPNNPFYKAYQNQLSPSVDSSSRVQNINTNVTVNTSQSADENMGRALGNGFNEQVGNAGYLNN